MRELMKIENWSRKRSHIKVDRIGVGRIKNVSISSDSVYDSVAKTRLSESEAEERSNRKARNRTDVIGLFIASTCDSDHEVFT